MKKLETILSFGLLLVASSNLQADSAPTVASAMITVSGTYELVSERQQKKSEYGVHCPKQFALDAILAKGWLSYRVSQSEAGGMFSGDEELTSAPTPHGLKRKVKYGISSKGNPFITIKDSDKRNAYGKNSTASETWPHRNTTINFQGDAMGTRLKLSWNYRYWALYSGGCYSEDFFPDSSESVVCEYRKL